MNNPEERKRFTLRIENGLFNSIKALAKKEKRATGKQIEIILEKYIGAQND